ncbi:MAG: helix-turn-helix domain-containing protein [Corallococcus sp.]|nr:helix-turn-helix domain-containing protein [Corallococcus sp.]MCM1359097.1 helix-turn-helix domain-containing protein [Corallococcus sp.]MCM1395086.1 helix-turn-helix domain-containing protein [Corallococcus sp.]
MKPKSNIDIVITGNVAWLDIQRDAKFLYGIIRGLTRNDNYCCYAANAYLAELLDVSEESTVRRYLRQLKALGALYCTNGYIIAENGKTVFRQRLIVLSELRKKFERKQEELRDLHDKSCKKNAVQAGKNNRPEAGNSARLNINKELPCKENIITTNNKKRNNPQPPCKGAEKAIEQTEQYLVLGKYANVRLTERQKGELVTEFGSSLALSLIEQLSCYIQSKCKRFRTDVDHYALLQDWCLRRLERQGLSNNEKRVRIAGSNNSGAYTQEQLDSLFTELEDEPDSST